MQGRSPAAPAPVHGLIAANSDLRLWPLFIFLFFSILLSAAAAAVLITRDLCVYRSTFWWMRALVGAQNLWQKETVVNNSASDILLIADVNNRTIQAPAFIFSRPPLLQIYCMAEIIWNYWSRLFAMSFIGRVLEISLSHTFHHWDSLCNTLTRGGSTIVVCWRKPDRWFWHFVTKKLI